MVTSYLVGGDFSMDESLESARQRHDNGRRHWVTLRERFVSAVHQHIPPGCGLTRVKAIESQPASLHVTAKAAPSDRRKVRPGRGVLEP
jgi:hypothetical protein